MGSQTSVGSQRPSSTTVRDSWILAKESPSSLSEIARKNSRTPKDSAKSPQRTFVSTASPRSPVEDPFSGSNPFTIGFLLRSTFQSSATRGCPSQAGDHGSHLSVRTAGNDLDMFDGYLEVADAVQEIP